MQIIVSLFRDVGSKSSINCNTLRVQINDDDRSGIVLIIADFELSVIPIVSGDNFRQFSFEVHARFQSIVRVHAHLFTTMGSMYA